jgi:superfamily I DNA/RNA helicase
MDTKHEATFAHYRRRAADAIDAGLIEPWYDAVLIDEAQDMPMAGLHVATGVARFPAYTFLTADANQSIYGTTFDWRSVQAMLGSKEQVRLLGSCHRCTAEIERAAASYLAGSELDRLGRAEPTTHRAGGSRPLAVEAGSAEEELKLLSTYLRQASRRAQVGYGSCAVLVPSTKTGEQMATNLTEAGIPALFVKGSSLELESPGVKVLTLHSAKGLEFPVVAIAGFLDSGLPGAGAEGGPGEWNEAFGKHRRTMYVGMTRAMRSLLVVRPRASDLALFQGFDDALWEMR